MPPSLAAVSELPASRTVPVGHMSPAELVRIARNQLDARSLSQKAARLLGTKSVGSPFFCLELVKLLTEQGVLYLKDGLVHVKEDILDANGGEVAIPDSVEQAIVSRIDRLDRKYLMALK
jgi:predicted ATPase